MIIIHNLVLEGADMSLNQVSTFNLWRGIKEMRRKLFEVLTVSVLVTALLAGCSEKNIEETEAEAAASVASSVEEKEMTHVFI